MDILNCSECGKPFRRKGNVQLCTTCLDQEHEMYDFYYRKFSRLISRMNFDAMEDKSLLNVKRLEKALEYRLGKGDAQELLYWKRGTCYVCTVRLRNPDSVEPICVSCLDHVSAMLEEEPAILGGQEAGSEGDAHVASSSEDSASLNAERSLASVDEEMIPRSLYEEVVQELDAYRKHFGPLPDSLPLELSTSSGKVSADFVEIMEILQKNDEDVALELDTAKRGVAGVERIQHYGFKRIFSA